MADDMRFVLLLLLLSGSGSCSGSDLDVQCLKTVQESVIDPNGILKSSWNFENNYAGYICTFTGVQCWHPDANRVLSLRLGNLGLEGQFPRGLENCTSMTGLDLSSNNFSGPIPSNIAWQLSSLTSLDLSYNNFSGEIPIGISNITYLNTLNLKHNQFSGQIPDRFEFSRLSLFSVADNQLSGPIPLHLQMFPPYNFTGNQGLCGAPLAACGRRRRSKWISDESCIGAAVGLVVAWWASWWHSTFPTASFSPKAPSVLLPRILTSICGVSRLPVPSLTFTSTFVFS